MSERNDEYGGFFDGQPDRRPDDDPFRNPLEATPYREPHREPYRQPVQASYGDPLRDPLTDPLTAPLRDPYAAPVSQPVSHQSNEPVLDSFLGSGSEPAGEPASEPVRPRPVSEPGSRRRGKPAKPSKRAADTTRNGRQGGGKKPKKKSGCGLPGCLAVLVALAVLIGGGWFALSTGIETIKEKLAGPADYPGPGTGQVYIEVKEGDTGTDIGNTLKSKGVVESVGAFTAAFAANPDAQGIQVGFYQLRKEMKASAALEVLVNPKNLIKDTVTIPEGLRAVDIVGILADKTKFSKAQFEKVLDKPASLGLPSYAQGNPEGYLFPATYLYPPNSTPQSMLKEMVDRWKQAAADADLAAAAKRLGYSPAEVMIVASLVEAEASRDQDRGKVARVIYNRLENPGTAGTTGKLQIDSTINYAMNRSLGVALTYDDLELDSPYNTYLHAGLPPTPIEAPGDAAIQAATHPTEGDWYYYVTVNLRTGETKFAETADEFAEYKQEYKHYCETSEAC